ncbi:MAG: ABC transporter permease [Clostridia bacterium]|nr:ABC transporter permease [Clostridia bacterium]
MDMFKYVVKRILLAVMCFVIITSMCFILIRIYENVYLASKMESLTLAQAEAMLARRSAMGMDKPIFVQLAIFFKNMVLDGNIGISMYLKPNYPVAEIIQSRLLPTVLVNVYSLVIAVPLGFVLGIYAALKKNKWQDNLISTAVMLFISVPSYVYAFLMQYFVFSIGRAEGMLVVQDAVVVGGYFNAAMLKSQILPVLALSFGSIAGYARYTRAELTESLTQDYMLLARTKGLKRRQAITRHAMKNAMVPILPMIIGEFIGVLGGSMVIENIFGIQGMGKLYIQAYSMFDCDVFVAVGMFYTVISLLAGILVDLSYGFIDPRIRMGSGKNG